MAANFTNRRDFAMQSWRASGQKDAPLQAEVFVGDGFCAAEAASITHVFMTANALLRRDRFRWRYISDTGGLVEGDSGLLVRAEPAIDDHGYSDVMFVVGGKSGMQRNWLPRARSVSRTGRVVVLLSEAATTYIKTAKNPPGRVTTHWFDAANLIETGYYPNLTTKIAETSSGIITAAGRGATAEIVIGQIASHLSSEDVAELSSRLLLPIIRKSDADQPRTRADNPALFDARVTAAIRLMEDTIAEPLSMTELTAKIGVSARHLERVFGNVFGQSPARFYKTLRTKRARAMIEETLLPLADIAIATGFGSTSTMSQSVRDTYGVTPSKMRQRRRIELNTANHTSQ